MQPLTAEILEAEIREAITAGDTERILALGATCDALTAKTLPALCASALWYADQGLHVFPVQARGKIPYKGTAGFKDATTDPDQIRGWWTAHPDANIGIATGHVVDVIDIDGPTGVRSWAKIRDDLPVILGKASTPRPGGNHLYVAATGLGNKAGLYPGVDYRGLGGYVVAPPSVNHQGRYVWYVPLTVPVGSP